MFPNALFRFAYVGNIDSQGSCQSDLMVLFLYKDLANMLGHGEFSQSIALSHPISVIADCFVFILQIKTEHLFRLLRSLHWLGDNAWHPAQVVAEIAANSGDRQDV